MARCAAGSSSRRRPPRARRRRSPRPRRPARPRSAAYASALARWWPAACGYGTQTIGSPKAAASASVDEPARPTTRSAAASAAVISSRRNGIRPVPVAAVRRQRLAGRHALGVGPVSPVTWRTQHRSTSRGSAPATAELNRRTACDPPKTSSRRGAGRDAEARSRAASRSTARGSRIGVPVTKQRATPSAAQVAAKLTATASARRAVARTLRPGTTLPSQSTIGMRRARAAARTGIAT